MIKQEHPLKRHWTLGNVLCHLFGTLPLASLTILIYLKIEEKLFGGKS